MSIDTTYTPPSGRTIAVPAGADFQAALNVAQPDDAIILQAGATYMGPFTLPKKSGTGWITVRSSAPDSTLPPPSTRVDPAIHAVAMPKIETRDSALGAIMTAHGAHHFRFVGLEVRPAAGRSVNALIWLGGMGSQAERSEELLPHHIVFDRCYLHGDALKGTRRAIVLNARSIAVIDSYLSDFKEKGADTQALVGWNGPGPFKIVNNYLEGAGENVMFGGASTTIPNLIPSDIEIRRNHFFKFLHWKSDDPSWDGSNWTVKNLFELKNAQRVLLDGNIFEHHWAGHNTAIVITPRNGEGNTTPGSPGNNPWSVTQDVTITNNIIRHAAGGIAIYGIDPPPPYGIGPTQRTQRILIKNNLFEDISSRWGGGGWLFLLTIGVKDLTIEHNTGFPDGTVITSDIASDTGPQPHTGVTFRNNLLNHGLYGAGTNSGLATNFVNIVFVRNVLIGPWPTGGGVYPYMYSDYPDNFFPDSLDGVGFLARINGNYRLSHTSRYKRAGTGERDIGADIDALKTVTAGVVSRSSSSDR